MDVDRELMDRQHAVFLLLAEGIAAIDRRSEQLAERILTTLKDIQDDLQTLAGDVDQLVAARSAQEAVDLDAVRAGIVGIGDKVKAALAPVSDVPAAAVAETHQADGSSV